MPPHQTPTDLENAVPFGTTHPSGMMALKSAASSQSLENLKGVANPSNTNILHQGKKTQGEKRKALLDITNKSSHQQQQPHPQPAPKKVKTSSTAIQVFKDQNNQSSSSNSSNSNSSQPPSSSSTKPPLKLNKSNQNTLLNRSSSRESSKSSSQPFPSNSIKSQLQKAIHSTTIVPENSDIEYCPEPYELPSEYPTPVYSEINSVTGEAEDLFITLSDTKMKELTKLPSKEGSFLSFNVNELITSNGVSGNSGHGTGTGSGSNTNACSNHDSANLSGAGTSAGVPPSPLPQPLTPVSFDDLFNFEVL
ncbi:hypothetical protein FDP41_009887 [Naegleria fowleri]|uniref:Uncharacterized protein n=1 Tax=Naegleria fowleri TaxID=5763 RepID=A0A6A5BC24_NAEFO|nr:uncharacterized protein FDP41_009887 [Naegleria fowleri]KAF0971664.1 hypothetical protein FDP41_009887 [Naegleria fowleri]CAG4719129.1 unnamed protein product [Naegleria fowleri]